MKPTRASRTGYLTREYIWPVASKDFANNSQLDGVAAEGLPRLPPHSEPFSSHSRLAPLHGPLQLREDCREGRREGFVPRRLALSVVVGLGPQGLA